MWPWTPKASILREAWCGGAGGAPRRPAPGDQEGRGAESALCARFPRFSSPSPAGRRAATGEGAGKKHLITGVSLLVTRRWQQLPWVSGFRERRVFCLEARAAAPPPAAGQPAQLPAPSHRQPVRPGGRRPLRGPGWQGSSFLGLRGWRRVGGDHSPLLLHTHTPAELRRSANDLHPSPRKPPG